MPVDPVPLSPRPVPAQRPPDPSADAPPADGGELVELPTPRLRAGCWMVTRLQQAPDNAPDEMVVQIWARRSLSVPQTPVRIALVADGALLVQVLLSNGRWACAWHEPPPHAFRLFMEHAEHRADTELKDCGWEIDEDDVGIDGGLFDDVDGGDGDGSAA